MIETRDCGCRTVIDDSGHVVMVGTCPLCLPVGAITWLIENGRQLSLWEGPLEPVEVPGGTHSVSGHETDEPVQATDLSIGIESPSSPLNGGA